MSIVLPAEALHAQGKLKFWLTRKHSPVEALHHTSVDGNAIGLFRSRMGSSEGLGQGPRLFRGTRAASRSEYL